MPDISMCLNKKCPLKETCYRYVAEPSEFRQSYSDFKYDNGCDYYWEFKGSRSLLNDLRSVLDKQTTIR